MDVLIFVSVALLAAGVTWLLIMLADAIGKADDREIDELTLDAIETLRQIIERETGRKWLDFISYDPRQSERFQLYVQRIERDDEYINNVLLPGLHAFWADVQKMVKVIEEKAA